jgi:hypothetical protein
MKKSTYHYIAILMAGIFSASISFAGGSMFGFSPVERLTDAISGISGKDPARAAEETKEATPEGLDAASQAINSNVETMLGSADIPNSKAYPSLYKGLMLYSANWGNCVSRQSKAASVCLETKAPALAALLPQLNILMSGVGTLSGVCPGQCFGWYQRDST